MPAPTVSASWKPSVIALGSALPVSSTASRRELPIEARTARPSAPPICWLVLIMPEARPASCGSTPATAAIVIGTNAKPRPKALTIDGPRMSVT